MLKNIYINNMRLGGLLVIFGAFVLLLQFFLPDNAAIILGFIPIIILYILERRGVVTIFVGITAPVIFLLLCSIILYFAERYISEPLPLLSFMLVTILAISMLNLIGRVMLMDNGTYVLSRNRRP